MGLYLSGNGVQSTSYYLMVLGSKSCYFALVVKCIICHNVTGWDVGSDIFCRDLVEV